MACDCHRIPSPVGRNVIAMSRTYEHGSSVLRKIPLLDYLIARAAGQALAATMEALATVDL